MDSSPVYPYYLFSNADEFHAVDKVKYAIHHVVGQRCSNRPLTPRELREHRHLIRSVEELQRTAPLKNTHSLTPDVDASCDMNQSSYPVLCKSDRGLSSLVASGDRTDTAASANAGTTEELWDNARSNTDLWNCPVEVLYQQYSLVIAIDFGVSSFCVSNRGKVLMDYVPCAVKTVLDVIGTTLKTRRQEAQRIKQWTRLHVEESEWENIFPQVWEPVVEVSVILINVPLLSTSPVPAHGDGEYLGPSWACGEGEGFLDFFPETAQSFPQFQQGFADDTTKNSAWIPLVTRCDADTLLRDSTFISRLGRTLSAYEEACRALSKGGWLDVSLFTSIEHIIRLVPERSSRCTSVVVLKNACEQALCDSYSLLESSVRRKNIILSLLFLSEAGFLQGSNVSLLSRFLLSVGGFAVHLDQWLSLGAPWINAEWCRRFSGSRCLAQQLLVQLDTKFPINVPHMPQNIPTTIPGRTDNHHILYDSSHGLEDFALLNVGDVVNLLQCVAGGRLNEGWSIVMNYSPDTPQTAHLYARWQYNMKRGRLIVSYEMDVSYPVVYRCVWVCGTRLLVEQFIKAKGDEKGVCGHTDVVKNSWITYLAVMRCQLDGWMRAEEVAMQCFRAAHRPPRSLILDEFRWLSCREGVSSWWLSYCDVRSIGVFVRWDDRTLRAYQSYGSGERSCASSIAEEAGRYLRGVLKKKHRPLCGSEGKDQIFLMSSEGCVQYVVQLLLLDDPVTAEHENLLAVGFELRFSFFLQNVETVGKMLSHVACDVKPCLSCSEPHAVQPRGGQALVVEADAGAGNGREISLYRLILLSENLERSGGRGVWDVCRPAHSGSVTSRSEAQALQSATGLSAKVRAAKTVHKFAYQFSLSPYVVSPWALADASVLHWLVETAGTWRAFAHASFNLFVTRRMRDGFKLLYCMTQCKAILHQRFNYGEHGEVDVFDVIVAPLDTTDGRAGPQIILYRFVRPFKFGISPRYRTRLTCDVAKDIQATTVLQTFEALSSAALPSGEGFCQPAREVQERSQLELLLPFCAASPGYTICLPLFPRIDEGEAKGTGEFDSGLREAVRYVASHLSDEYIFVPQRQIPKTLWQRVYGSDPGDDSQEHALLVCALKPMRCNCVTFLLIGGSPTSLPSAEKCVVAVHVISLDAVTLYEGVMRLNGSVTNDARSSEVHRCLDSALQDSLSALLTCFGSLYVGRELLQYERNHPKKLCDLKSASKEELLRILTPFEDYCREIDISYLLFMRRQYSASCVKERELLRRRLESLIGSVLHLASLQPLSSFPTVFLRGGTVAEETPMEELIPDGRDNPIIGDVPFLMKIALLHVTEGNEVRDCVWISATSKESYDTSECVKWLLNTLTNRGNYPQEQRLLLQCFIKTCPRHFFDLAEGNCRPTPDTVKRVLRTLQSVPQNQTRLDQRDCCMRTFFSGEVHAEDLYALRCSSFRYDEIPVAARHPFDTLIWGVVSQLVQYSLEGGWQSSPFQELRNIVMGKQVILTAESLGGECGASSGITRGGVVEVCGEDIDMGALAHASRDVVDAANQVVGLAELVSLMVVPALLSVPCFEFDSFTIRFMGQPIPNSAENPSNALHDVFTRCFPEDHVCVVQASDDCYLFVPNKRYFSSWWLIIHVSSCGETAAEHKLRLLSDNAQHSDVCGYVGRHLRWLIEAKVRKVSQLYLLRQLRDTQSASKELVPSHWGNQFEPPITANKGKKSSGLPGQSSTLSMAFHCRGVTVLKIPVYYKLQHQCQKVLNRIANSSSRLELISIYNREQCFIVADDAQRDTFHYIRLVFVKDTSSHPSVTEPSPALSPADCCPFLVVQLFSATKNALIQRPLRKLEEFCYLLAVQELRDHLNYVQHKVISAVDLMFLQYRALEPISIDLRERNENQTPDEDDTQLAFAFVAFSLNEKKFKHFEVESDRSNAISNFMEYYKLQGNVNGSGCVAPVVESGNDKMDYEDSNKLLRFVKVIEKKTDILVSCSLCVGEDSKLLIERFLTKSPGEGFAAGVSEASYLAQIDEAIHVGLTRWRFFVMSRGFSHLTLRDVPHAVNEMIHYSTNVACSNSSVLRFKKFPLERVSLTVFPSLVERIVGVLEPLAPVCLERRPDCHPSHVVGFPWKWVEELQGNPHAEHVELIITCGFCVSLGSVDSPDDHAPVTRAMRVVHPDLPVGRSTTLARSHFLLSHNIKVPSLASPRAVVRISLTDGLAMTLIDLLDSDNWVRLVGHVVAEAERESDLMHDIMVQRMGISLPSHLTEPLLVNLCCGTSVDGTREGPLNIRSDACRWTTSDVRLLPHSSLRSDMLTIIMEGLSNRGLLGSNTIKIEDAVKVLYNECPQLSLTECHNVLRGLVHEGVLKVKHKVLTFRTGGAVCLMEDVMTACALRRHVHSAHLLIESQHWQRGNAEALQQIASLWRTTSRDDEVRLARAVVSLQNHNKQIYGSRVLDFTIRSRTHWQPSDDVLSPSLPRGTNLNSEYCPSIDSALHSYILHIRRAFPTARIIDLDPQNTVMTSDPTLLSRFRCRYGKMVSVEAGEITFVPHLYYVLVPIGDVMKMMRLEATSTADLQWIVKDGLFIAEVGFQVVHFALDVFMVNGWLPSDGATANAAAWFKRKLMFNTVLYDLTVWRLLHCVQMYTTLLPGQLQTSDAIENLVKYYPNPPHGSLNVAAIFDLDEARLRRLQCLLCNGQNTSGEPNEGCLQQLIPEQCDLLRCETTGEKYQYCGLVLWSSSRLLVLVSAVRDVALCERRENSGLQNLVVCAKTSLLRMLMDKTVDRRLELTWTRFLDPQMGALVLGGDDMEETLYDLRVLQTKSAKVSIIAFFEPYTSLNLDWGSLLIDSVGGLSRACPPGCALHLLPLAGGGVVLVLARGKPDAECLLAVEFSRDDGEGGLRNATLCRRFCERATPTTAMSERELELVECMLGLLSSLLWYVGSS